MSASPFPPETNGGVVSLEELKEALGSIAVVDVREPNEFLYGRIPGAINLPLSKFNPADLPAGKSIVLVCQAGVRSAGALKAALAAGINDIRHYPGGMGEWRAYDEEIED